MIDSFERTLVIRYPVLIMWAFVARLLPAPEKDGYLTVYQPFDVTLNADMQYEWTVTLLAAGEAA